jgi:hypothetical protein
VVFVAASVYAFPRVVEMVIMPVMVLEMVMMPVVVV